MLVGGKNLYAQVCKKSCHVITYADNKTELRNLNIFCFAVVDFHKQIHFLYWFEQLVQLFDNLFELISLGH